MRNPIHIQIPKTEKNHAMEGPDLEFVSYAQPLRTCKVNIGTKENPKFVQIGYY